MGYTIYSFFQPWIHNNKLEPPAYKCTVETGAIGIHYLLCTATTLSSYPATQAEFWNLTDPSMLYCIHTMFY